MEIANLEINARTFIREILNLNKIIIKAKVAIFF
jgi:hypothetical protein